MPTRHYYVFDNSESLPSLDKSAWDSLRTGTDNHAFRFESSVEEYEANCARRTDCREVAEAIRDMLPTLGKEVSRLVSLGVGKGIVEWHLKRLVPELNLTCTDYAKAGVDNLRRYFHACDEVMPFDMLNSDYSTLGGSPVLLMNRVSTEFTPTEWQQIFRSCKAAGIKHILFIPTELASIRLKTMETLRHFIRKTLGRRDTFCGWLYSKHELELAMSQCYKIEKCTRLGNSALYLLSIRDQEMHINNSKTKLILCGK